MFSANIHNIMKRISFYNSLLLIIAVTVFAACQGKTAQKPDPVQVMTFNIRLDVSSDSLNSWPYRKAGAAHLIAYYAPDLLGMQEVLPNQLADLKQALPQYTALGVGRDDGKEKGEHSAIFYRTDKFELIEKGDFWLSETPDKPSKGWDAVLPRICSWGHFKCKDTGFEFLFFNLHMDHVGKKARVESALLVQEKMKEFGTELPAILTGDFNVDQTHQSYEALVSKGVLKDSYEAADFRYATNGTFNSFNPNLKTDSRIDHVFISKQFTVKKYGVLTDTYRSEVSESQKEIKSGNFPKEVSLHKYQARTPSDHFPVMVVLTYKK